MFISHVTMEIPVGHLDEAVEWFRTKLGLHPFNPRADDDDPDAEAVWFAEGVRILPCRKMWQSNPHRIAHFCLVVHDDRRFELIRELTKHHNQEVVSDNRFFILTPWTNRIEICR